MKHVSLLIWPVSKQEANNRVEKKKKKKKKNLK